LGKILTGVVTVPIGNSKDYILYMIYFYALYLIRNTKQETQKSRKAVHMNQQIFAVKTRASEDCTGCE